MWIAGIRLDLGGRAKGWVGRVIRFKIGIGKRFDLIGTQVLRSTDRKARRVQSFRKARAHYQGAGKIQPGACSDRDGDQGQREDHRDIAAPFAGEFFSRALNASHEFRNSMNSPGDVSSLHHRPQALGKPFRSAAVVIDSLPGFERSRFR